MPSPPRDRSVRNDFGERSTVSPFTACRFSIIQFHNENPGVLSHRIVHVTGPLFVIYSQRRIERMPLFKARATPRSPVTEKVAANGVQHRGIHHQHHQPHQAGGDNGHDSGASDNGTAGGRSGNGAPPLQQEQMRPPSREPKPSTLVFHCQLAHGSPTGLISDFSNVRELYQKIAERYDLPAEEVSSGNCDKRPDFFLRGKERVRWCGSETLPLIR